MLVDETDRLYLQLRAGEIKRYHAHPIIGEQTVGQHTYGVAQLVRYLTNDNCSKELLCAALDHDVPELVMGDTPRPAKVRSKELSKALDGIEKALREEYKMVYNLTQEEKSVLKAADLFEMGFFGLWQLSLGNKAGGHIVEAVVEGLDSIALDINGVHLQTVIEGEYDECKR